MESSKQNINTLLLEIKRLREENSSLKNELSENTVIESMNYMKETYNTLEKNYQNIKEEFDIVLEKYEKIESDSTYLQKDAKLLFTIQTTVLQIIILTLERLRYLSDSLDHILNSKQNSIDDYIIDIGFLKTDMKNITSYMKTCKDVLESIPDKLLKLEKFSS